MSLLRAKPARTLFGSLVVTIFLAPILNETPLGGIVISVLVSVVLLSALNLVAERRLFLGIGLGLFLPSLALIWAGVGLNVAELLGVGRILSVLFLTVTMGAILHRVLRARQVTAEVLYAAVSVYLLIGLVGAFAFSALLVWQPGALDVRLVPIPPEEEGALKADLLYYSFVTQTTLGYGDILPVTALARMTAIFLAIGGVLYLAVLVATLVGVYVAQANSREG